MSACPPIPTLSLSIPSSKLAPAEVAQAIQSARDEGTLQFLWFDSEGLGRNRFAIFRNVFELPDASTAAVTGAVLHLFAECRYVLNVNGKFVSSGPGRYVPEHPEFDSVDLAPYLTDGRNVIEVVVNTLGVSSFQVMRDSIGAFLATGIVELADADPISLDTPGYWLVHQSNAWDHNATPFSFAQGPVEILDTRKLPGLSEMSDFAEPVAITRQNRWGALRPRSIPPLCFERQGFSKTVIAAEASDEEILLSAQVVRTDKNAAAGAAPHPLGCVAAWLHSAEAQQIEIGAFWGPFYLNGELLKGENGDLRGNRLNLTLDLKAGWNLFYGEVSLLKETWAILLGLPRSAKVTPRISPYADAAEGMLLAGPISESELAERREKAPASAADLAEMQINWEPVDLDNLCPIPSRLMAWQRPGPEVLVSDQPFTGSLTLPINSRAGALAVLDFEGEFLGHPTLEIEAPAGTVLDLGYDERLREDKCLGLYLTNPFTNTVDRVVANGGRQVIQGFHVRGGRYLQISSYLPAGVTSGEVKIHRAEICRTQIPVPGDENFSCDDDVFNWTWKAGLDTLRGCLEELYMDCPWRERGTYLGDSYVIQRMHRLVDSDYSVQERVLQLFAEAQLPGGKMLAVAPSWLAQPFDDFTLIWILYLRNHWAWSGNRKLVEELWPALERIWAAPSWQADESGLWNGEVSRLFVDWGIRKEERVGKANGALNAFRYGALQASLELATALGKQSAADRFREEASQLKANYNKVLWDSAAQRYRTAEGVDAAENPGGFHSNVLAVLFGLADDSQIAAVKPFLLERAQKNFQNGIEGGQNSGHAELYFLNYVLDLLYDLGEVEQAEEVIREHYGYIRSRGGWTIWECFCRGHVGLGSMCHAWSTAPNFIFIERTLGLRPADPGEPNTLVARPASASLQRARGTFAHPKGPVTVAWERQGDALQVNITKPAEVNIRVEPAGELAKLRLSVQFGGDV